MAKTSEEYRKIIGENLKFWRKIRGYRQDYLGEKSGSSRTYISKIESGLANPTLEYLEKLVEVLDIQMEDLMTPQPYKDIILEIINDKTIQPPLTEEEIRDLLSIRLRINKPDKKFFLFVLDMIRSGRVFNK